MPPYIRTMRQIALPLALCLTLSPAWAQETAEDGPGLMERGAELFLRGLMSEMEPGLREMEQALRLMEPELRALMELVGDLRNYEAPERLPNGDILIRRKPDAPAPETPEAPETPAPDAAPAQPEIEL